MGPPSQALHEWWPATPASVAAARHRVRRYAVELEVDLDGLILAVSEAVANVVAHAYPDGVDGRVELTAGTSPTAVTVTVRDNGRGLTRSDRPGAGFGLTIIRRVAEHVELTDTPDGVSLTMAFRRGRHS